MAIDPGVNNLLEGGGKSLSWDGQPPITHTITVESAKTQQATEMGSGKPRYFDSGDPIMDIVISGHIDKTDGPDDDGSRRLFIKNDAIRALREALKAAGAQLDRGGILAVQYYADEQKKAGAKKLYRAQYKPPAPTTAANDLLGTPSHASSASWAEDGGTPRPAPAEAKADFDPFMDT